MFIGPYRFADKSIVTLQDATKFCLLIEHVENQEEAKQAATILRPCNQEVDKKKLVELIQRKKVVWLSKVTEKAYKHRFAKTFKCLFEAEGSKKEVTIETDPNLRFMLSALHHFRMVTMFDKNPHKKVRTKPPGSNQEGVFSKLQSSYIEIACRYLTAQDTARLRLTNVKTYEALDLAPNIALRVDDLFKMVQRADLNLARNRLFFFFNTASYEEQRSFWTTIQSDEASFSQTLKWLETFDQLKLCVPAHMLQRLSAPLKAKVVFLKVVMADNEVVYLISTFKNLVGLHIEFSRSLSSVNLEPFKSLEKLEQLHLMNANSIVGLETVAKLRFLSINLAAAYGVTDEHLKIIGSYKNLSTLVLTPCNKLSSRGLNSLKGLGTLTELSLREFEVTDEFLSKLPHLPKLRHLDIAGSCKGKVNLKPLGRFSTLEGLNLSGISVDCEMLQQLKPLQQLKSFKIGGANFKDADLIKFQFFQNLVYLCLRGIKIREEGLLNLKVLVNLVHLDLCNANILDADLIHLTALNIQILDLTGCLKVTVEGLQLLKNSKLKKLLCSLEKQEAVLLQNHFGSAIQVVNDTNRYRIDFASQLS